MDEVVGFERPSREVMLDRGAQLNYDYLIVANERATGHRLALKDLCRIGSPRI
jgi:NADH dehydrogenase FAD-containing subunit